MNLGFTREEFLQYVGEALALIKYKKRKEVTNNDIKKGTGIGQTSLHGYTKGRNDIPLYKALVLCRIFKITIKDLVGPYDYDPEKDNEEKIKEK